MKTSGALACVALTALLTGCAQYQWQKPGATLAGLNQDMGACRAMAIQQWPVEMVTRKISDAYRVPATRKCTTKGNTTECETTAAHWVPAEYVTSDVNKSGREEQIEICIYGRGYDQVKIQDSLFDRLTGNLTAMPALR